MNDFDRQASLQIAKSLGLDVPDIELTQETEVKPEAATEQTQEQPWYSKYTEADIEELKRKASLVDSKLDSELANSKLPPANEVDNDSESVIDKLVREAGELLKAEAPPAESEQEVQSEPEQKSDAGRDAGEEWGRNVAKVALQRGYDAKEILATLSDMPIEELVEVAAFKLKHIAQSKQQPQVNAQPRQANTTTVNAPVVAEVRTADVKQAVRTEQYKPKSIFR